MASAVCACRAAFLSRLFFLGRLRFSQLCDLLLDVRGPVERAFRPVVLACGLRRGGLDRGGRGDRRWSEGFFAAIVREDASRNCDENDQAKKDAHAL